MAIYIMYAHVIVHTECPIVLYGDVIYSALGNSGMGNINMTQFSIHITMCMYIGKAWAWHYLR